MVEAKKDSKKPRKAPRMASDEGTAAAGSSRGRGGHRGGGGGGRGRGGGRGSDRPQGRHHGDQKEKQRELTNRKVDMRKYDKMIAYNENNFSDIVQVDPVKDECTICCKLNDVFGVGPCRHPICIECAIRLRVLGGQTTCPVCRSEVDIMCFGFAKSDLSKIRLEGTPSKHPDEERFKVTFENEAAGIRYEKYLAHVCKICKMEDGERLEFPTFVSLRQHMSEIHHLSYCHICTDNLNLFSRERKTYTRENLTRHLKFGDPEDKSQTGHPTCLFCDQRFFDEELRYRHLRKDHFFCQFCEAAGTSLNTFYGKHDELVAHYVEKHYVCDVPECKQAGIAFADPFDLKIHKSKDHGNSRQGIQLDFQYSDRQLGRGALSGRGRGGRPERPAREERPEFVVVPSAQYRGPIRFSTAPAYNTSANAEQFPSLPGSSAPAAAVNPNAFPRLGKVNKPGQAPKAPALNQHEAFPSLSARPSASKKSAAAGDWGRHTGVHAVIDDDERRAGSSRAAPTPTNKISVVPKPPPSQQTKKPPPQPTPRYEPVEDFPTLPAAGPSTMSPRPKPTANYANKAAASQPQKIGGLLAHAQPTQQKKKKKKTKPDVPYVPPEYVEPPEAEWEDVPVKPKIVKGKKVKKALESNQIVGAVVPSGFSALSRGRQPSSSEESDSDEEEAAKPAPAKPAANQNKPAQPKKPANDEEAKTNSNNNINLKKNSSTAEPAAPEAASKQNGGILSGLFSFTDLISSWTSPVVVDSAPPGIAAPAKAPTPTTNSLSFAPPPGFEGVVPKPNNARH
ncbi:unnamed protein product, partial [Mesorhabditis spiculigera]